MIREHMERHGQSYFHHLSNNLRFTWLAFKSALYTLGHGIYPGISGMKASELHSKLWEDGRQLSIGDIEHRLASNLYSNRDEALDEFKEYAALYDERPIFAKLEQQIEKHFNAQNKNNPSTNK